jgi:DNA-binding IscR family transcriptional regulator
VREVFDAAEDALRGVFDSQTLADITRRREALREHASMYHI